MLGKAESGRSMWAGSAAVCAGRVPETSIFSVLEREGAVLFPDVLFEDLYASGVGRPSVPPRTVATVMVLQRLFGFSDREAVQAFEFDARWKWACGGLDLDSGGFSHSVLVDMRSRLARSARPRRLFEVTLDAALAAGLVGHRRVLDSTPLYDAVATMDTITLLRTSIRNLFSAADDALEVELRAVIVSGDDYASVSKPSIEWDDTDARGELIASRAADGMACLAVLEGRSLEPGVADAAALVARVIGQDLEVHDGTFRIARRVAKDRVISTVDPEARHGHKTQARGFDGYKGHVAIDPDSEIITETTVTPGNAGDAAAAQDLVGDLASITDEAEAGEAEAGSVDAGEAEAGEGEAGEGEAGEGEAGAGEVGGRGVVFGDSAYGAGAFLAFMFALGLRSMCKTQRPAPLPGGLFTKEAFLIDLDDDIVQCPRGVEVKIRRAADGTGAASFGAHCTGCPFATVCTTAQNGRTISVGVHERLLQAARAEQTDPDWQAAYRATRPKVERKLAHLMRRKHGGRRARVRGTTKVAADFNLLAAAHNLARLATMRVVSTPSGWQISPQT